MFTYLLTGKIHPERVDFTIGMKMVLSTYHPDFGIKGDVVLEIKNSSILISFESETLYSLEDTGALETLKNIIEDGVRMVVDAYCYVRSYAYEVEITDIKSLAPKLEYQFGVRGEWNINKGDEIASEEFSKMLSVVSKNNLFTNVLADFRRSIKYPAMTASFCFRAIETIRQHVFEDESIGDDIKRRDNGWENLRKSLNLKKESFSEITKFAIPNRHGKYPAITYKERERIMNFTRFIIDRLIDQMYSGPENSSS